MGKPGFPIPLLKRQSVATKVTAPLPSPPPAGGRESGASPQRGEVGRGAGAPHALRWKGLALVAYVHISRPCSYAAHKQKIGSSLEGCALPDPPAGGGVGKPGFPTPLGPMFTLAVHAATPHTNRMKIGSSLEGCVLPNPPAGGGMGEPGSPISLREGQARPRAGAWGNPLSPDPCAGATLSQTLRRAGGWGNLVPPYPCVRASPSQTLLRAGGWGNLVPPCSPQGARGGFACSIANLARDAARDVTSHPSATAP